MKEMQRNNPQERCATAQTGEAQRYCNDIRCYASRAVSFFLANFTSKPSKREPAGLAPKRACRAACMTIQA